MHYKFVDGSKWPRNEANRVGKRLGEIAKEKGVLQAEDVLEDASNGDSPLHGLFEWDDTTAAREYRLEQARRLVRSVVVVIEKNGTPREMRAYVHIDTATEGKAPEPAYVSTVRVLKKSALRARLVKQALAEARVWQKRYEHLSELSEIFAAIERTGDARPNAQRGRRGAA